MTSFSLFIYYIAALTIQLEMEQLGLVEDESTIATRRRMIAANGGQGTESINETQAAGLNAKN